MLFRLLVLVDRDLVITLIEIAYNVNDNLDEVLLAIGFTANNGNIFNGTLLVLKVVVSEHTVEAEYPRACGGNNKTRLVSYFHISC